MTYSHRYIHAVYIHKSCTYYKKCNVKRRREFFHQFSLSNNSVKINIAIIMNHPKPVQQFISMNINDEEVCVLLHSVQQEGRAKIMIIIFISTDCIKRN